MALPTIRYFAATAAAGSSLVSVWMAKLHALLVTDSGWTIEYADTDAIGSGSAGTPAWDKTPAASVDAGIAVYRMPENGYATRWYVRVRPGWAAATTRPHMRGLQVGTTHAGSGVVTGGSSEMEAGAGSISSDARAWKMSVSEDGFAFAMDGTASQPPMFWVDRARKLDGSILDDVVAFNQYTATLTSLGRHASASVGSVSTFNFVQIATAGCGAVVAASTAIPSLESSDAAGVAAIGPYYPGGDPVFAPSRLLFLANPADVTADTSRVMAIDGGNKTYQVFGAPVGNSAGAGIWLAATN